MVSQTFTITIQQTQEQIAAINPEVKITTEQHAANFNRAQQLFFEVHNAAELPFEDFVQYVDTIQSLHKIATETFKKRLQLDLRGRSIEYQEKLDKQLNTEKRQRIVKDAKKLAKHSKSARRELLVQELMDSEGITEQEAKQQIEALRASWKK